MIKTKTQVQNYLEGKNCINKLFLVNTHLILHQMVARGQFCCPLIGSPRSEVINIKRNWILKYILMQNTRHLHPFCCLCHHGTRFLCLATLRFVWNNQFFKQKGKGEKDVIIISFFLLVLFGSVERVSF